MGKNDPATATSAIVIVSAAEDRDRDRGKYRMVQIRCLRAGSCDESIARFM